MAPTLAAVNELHATLIHWATFIDKFCSPLLILTDLITSLKLIKHAHFYLQIEVSERENKNERGHILFGHGCLKERLIPVNVDV